MICKHCRKQIPDSAAYCVYCGTSTSSNEQTPQTYHLKNSVEATRSKRFINLLVDGFIINTLVSLLSMIGLGFLLGGYGYFGFFGLRWLLIPFAYYFFCELLWAKTPAKFLTKTRVVTDTQEKPTASHIAIRTLCRWIPFEAITFLFKRRPVGWHDHFSHTRVVEE